jgi:hypothetical protein
MESRVLFDKVINVGHDDLVGVLLMAGEELPGAVVIVDHEQDWQTGFYQGAGVDAQLGVRERNGCPSVEDASVRQRSGMTPEQRPLARPARLLTDTGLAVGLRTADNEPMCDRVLRQWSCAT